MIVCHCHAVRDREIRQCVRHGHCSLEEIAECTLAGSGCGGCHDSIVEVIEGEQARAGSEMPAVAATNPGVRHLSVVLSEVA